MIRKNYNSYLVTNSELIKKINFNTIDYINLNNFKNCNKHKVDSVYSKDVYENANNTYNDF